MTTMLNILEGFLYHKGLTYYRIDGNTSQEERESQINAFNNKSDNDKRISAIFLLSTRAGGVGINLQAADTVLIFLKT